MTKVARGTDRTKHPRRVRNSIDSRDQRCLHMHDRDVARQKRNVAGHVHVRSQGGGAGNRTRVLCRLIKASPCAAHCASTRPRRSHELVRCDGPSRCGFPDQCPRPTLTVSLLADAGIPGRRRSWADTVLTRSGGEGVLALRFIGAYWFTTTLKVVSRLHLHASLDSTSRVETVHPLVGGCQTAIITPERPAIIPITPGWVRHAEAPLIMTIAAAARTRPMRWVQPVRSPRMSLASSTVDAG
jgi:hypothetical protein